MYTNLSKKLSSIFLLTILLLNVAIPFILASPTDVVAGSTTSGSIENHVWYASGRFWIMYSTDGGDIYFTSSADSGVTWATPTLFNSGNPSGKVDVALDSDGVRIHTTTRRFQGTFVNFASAYRSGTCNADGTISWTAAFNLDFKHSFGIDVSITLDSSDNPWITLEWEGYSVQSARRSTTSDGTFTLDAMGEVGIYGGAIGVDPKAKIAALPDEDMYVIYTKQNDNGDLYGKLWNKPLADWLPEETITTLGGISNSAFFSVMSDTATGFVYLTYIDKSDGKNYMQIRTPDVLPNGTWSAPIDITESGNSNIGARIILDTSSNGGVWVGTISSTDDFYITHYNNLGVATTTPRIVNNYPDITAFELTPKSTTGMGIYFTDTWGIKFEQFDVYSNFLITNMEGSTPEGKGLKVIVAEYIFYNFQMNIFDDPLNPVEYASIRFFNNDELIQFDYNVTTGLSYALSGKDYVRLSDATSTSTGGIRQINWGVWIKSNIVDDEYADFETYFQNVGGFNVGWTSYVDYCGIYDLGHWTTNTASGYATSTTTVIPVTTTSLTCTSSSQITTTKTTITSSSSTTSPYTTQTTNVYTTFTTTTSLVTYVQTTTRLTKSTTTTKIPGSTTRSSTSTYCVTMTWNSLSTTLFKSHGWSTATITKLTSTTSCKTTCTTLITTSVTSIVTSAVTTSNTSTIIQSDASGKTTGGGVFDIFVYDNSVAYGRVEVRNLQNVHALVNVNVDHQEGWDDYEADSVPIEFGIDFWDDTTKEYVTGWSVLIELQDGWLDANTMRLSWNVAWYYNGALQTSTILMNSYPLTNDLGDDYPSSTSFIVDLWYDKTNSSSVVAGRITSEYWAVSDTANPWLRWATGSNWGAVVANASQVMFYHDLDNNYGDTISGNSVAMSYAWAKISQDNNNHGIIYSLRDWDVLDWGELRPDDAMAGINTPQFVKTKMPDMAQGGFFNSLWAALQQTFQSIAGLFVGTLGFLGEASFKFVDAVLAFFGLSGAFHTITDTIVSFWNVLTKEIVNIVTILLTTIGLVSSLFGYILYGFTVLANIILTIINTTIGIISGTSTLTTGLGNIWATLNLAVAFPLIIILLLVQWFISLDERSEGSFGSWFKMFYDEGSIVMGVVIGSTRFLLDLFLEIVLRFIEFIRGLMPVV